MKKIILIFGLLLFNAITFSQTGCISGDCQNGFGKNVFTDSKDNFTYYEGNWQKGLYDGQGTLQTQDKIYIGNFVEGKKQGIFKVYEGNKIKDKYIVFEGEYINDQLGNSGTYTDRFSTSVWEVVGNKVIATIKIKSAGIMLQAQRGESNWASYKGEVLSKEHPDVRDGFGTLYQNIWSPDLKYGFYKNDKRANSPEEQLAADKYTEAHKDDCSRCRGDGHIYEKRTFGGGTYTTGGETMTSQHATTSGIIEKSDGSKYIESTTTSGTYQNPTYTHTAGSYEKYVKEVCPVCNGTGRKK